MHKIFISHIHEEKALALAIKLWLESSFPDKVEVFVSSDENDLPPGSRWLEKVSQALHEAELMLMLCSAQALQRAWINFEAGCAWTKKIPIMPICHSGQQKSSLPSPLSSFQALELESEDSCQSMIQGVGNQLSLKVPRIDYKTMKYELMQSLGKIAVTPSASLIPNPRAIDPNKEELEILVKLSRAGVRLDAEELAHGLELNLERVEFHLQNMVERDWIDPSYVIGEPAEYRLSHEGRKILIGKNLI